MATIRIVLGIICLTFFGQFIEPSGDFLRREGRKGEGGKVEGWKVEGSKVEGLGFRVERLGVLGQSSSRPQVNKIATENRKLTNVNRELILRIARSQMGVREATGKNDGRAVEAYLNYTGNKKGEPWCASFVSWIYGKAGFVQPKTAWSPSLFPRQKRVINPMPADVFGIYFSNLKRIAHCGLVESTKGNWIVTIEGNTNLAGSREGDGVYRKLRHRRNIQSFSNWIDQNRKGVTR